VLAIVVACFCLLGGESYSPDGFEKKAKAVLRLMNKIMARPKKAKVVKKEIKKFRLTLDLKDIKFLAEADTFQEALEQIYKDSFGKIKTWGTFIVETQGKKSQIQLRPIQIKRAFLGRFAQDLLQKRLSMMLK
jgi:hypothetical protein